MPRKWTEEQKRAQAEKIKQWKPWASSTGPTSAAGKAKCSRNALTHGAYTDEFKTLREILHHNREFRVRIDALIKSGWFWGPLRERTIKERRENNDL